MLNIKQVVQSLSAVMKAFTYLPVREFQRYSTDEIVVGQWTDGKPLYRKVIRFGALPNNTTKTVAHGIQDVEYICRFEGLAFNPSTGTVITLPFVGAISGTSLEPFINVQVNATNISVMTGSDRSALTWCYFTIHYTKTTDTASSPKVPYEPLVEYSTEEKMIGYWIDGKPLYRKYIKLTNSFVPNVGTWTVVNGVDASAFDVIASVRSAGNNQGSYGSNVSAFKVNNGNLEVYTNGGNKLAYDNFIIEYTKTTD